jgi:hypothetical protein
MTIPENSTTPATDAVKSLRTLFAFAILGYVAIKLFFNFFLWILPSGSTTLPQRSHWASSADLVFLALPLVAVLIASVVRPALGTAKLISLIALITYAFMLFFFGLTFLIGLGWGFGNIDSVSDSIGALQYLVVGILGVALIGLGGFATFKVFIAQGGKLPV